MEKKEIMSEKRVRVRIAPSPTGDPHVGTAYIGLFNYVFAKHNNGDFLLRIEDTDRTRFSETSEQQIFDMMRWLGINYDEGPDIGGDKGPYRQSERFSIYKEYAEKLVEKGEAYYCFCTPERLNSLRSNVNGEEIMKYDKHCLSLSEEEIKKNLESGIPYVIRQNNPTTGTTSFHDDIYGDITVDNSELDDMVLIKSDGYPTYNFANVVDDHLMGITHVVRGNEYLSSSPKYNRLYEAFGWEVPTYVHCPLITNEEHKKLSKRSGHSSFEDLIEQGYVSEAIVNFVALLGWSPEDDKEIFSLEELIKAFDYKHISKSPAVFDMVKLSWMNGEYLKNMSEDDFFKLAEPYIKEVIKKPLDLKKISNMVKTRIEVLPQIASHIDFFEELPEYDIEMYTHKKMKTNSENSLSLLKEVLPLLENTDDYTNDNLFAILQEFGKEHEYKTGFIMWPIRTALSGKQMTPAGATEIMEVLGKDESIRRIKIGIDKLQQ